MIHDQISEGAYKKWMLIPVHDVIICDRQRPLVEGHVEEVMDSFGRLGGQIQIQPISVSSRENGLRLIDGLHRLTGARRMQWTHIAAEVWFGLNDRDEQILEAEANRVSLELTPLQKYEAWVTVYQPAHEARAAQQRERGLKNLKQNANQDEPLVPQLLRNESEPVSVREAAKQTTGISHPTLEKMREICETAESEEAPEPLRAAAQRGKAKLAELGAQVEPIYKDLQKTKEAVQRQGEDPQVAKRREDEASLDNTVKTSTLLAERLSALDYAESLALAAKGSYLAREELRGARKSLAHSLASLVAIECTLASDRQAELAAIGQEIIDLMRSTLDQKFAGFVLPEVTPNAA